MWKYLLQNWQKEAEETDVHTGIWAIKIGLFLIGMLVCVLFTVYTRRDLLCRDQTLPRTPQHEDSVQPLFKSERELIDTALKTIKEEGDLNVRLDEKGRTLLHIAASSGYNKAVKLLIENGADVNPVDVDGISPVGSAFLQGQNETLMLLYDYGGKIKLKN
jgi:hypothetical protein